VLISQTLIDDADPINYAKVVGQRQRTLLFEVKDDEVIPNAVLGAPLSGTEPLLKNMGAKSLPIENAPALVSVPKVVYAKFIVGEHSSLLRPTYPETTIEMHKEMISYIQSSGQKVLVEDIGILEK